MSRPISPETTHLNLEGELQRRRIYHWHILAGDHPEHGICGAHISSRDQRKSKGGTESRRDGLEISKQLAAGWTLTDSETD